MDQATETLFENYGMSLAMDEMFRGKGVARRHYEKVFQSLSHFTAGNFNSRQQMADLLLITQGITFTVYGDNQGIEKPFPVDLIPRIIPSQEWDHIERGLIQRVTALNLFLDDIYHEERILKENRIPRDLVVNAPNFRREFVGAKVPGGVYVHICGSDLIRDSDGTYRILEDNCRTPSGVSYMLENRLILMRVFPALFREHSVKPIDSYPSRLLQCLMDLAPANIAEPAVVLLTPGVYNSAYFEHCFLAQQMGIQLVEGRDLFVEDNVVYMKTTQGPQRVDVIYRRVDDDYLDPLTFRPESTLGVPGLVNSYRAGNVALANGIGTGVADDKSIYPYVPEMIRFYLDQEPIIPQVETYMGWRPQDLTYILENAHNLVIKAANESGGYGMLMGPQATKKEIEEYLVTVRANPRNFVGQPLIQLSTTPCFTGEQIEPRHIDLRPYVLTGPKGSEVVPGGLTRVALRKGSYVVNSSQGGGSKDTWVLAEDSSHA